MIVRFTSFHEKLDWEAMQAEIVGECLREERKVAANGFRIFETKSSLRAL